MAVKLGLFGVCGRMGQRLATLAHEDPDLQVAWASDHPNHPWIGKDLGAQLGLGEWGVSISSKADVPDDLEAAIDFTLPEASVGNGQACAENSVPLVMGTTGLSDEQKKELYALTDKLPLIHAANCSVGVNVLCKAASVVAKSLGDDYEIEIVEAHHDKKVDAPSGTALKLAEVVADSLDRDLNEHAVYGREGHTGKRTQKEIGIHAVRLADTVGEHTVYFAIGGERIELTHRAYSRDTFARGALRAAKWMAQNNKGPGRYSMDQVLGLDS